MAEVLGFVRRQYPAPAGRPGSHCCAACAARGRTHEDRPEGMAQAQKPRAVAPPVFEEDSLAMLSDKQLLRAFLICLVALAALLGGVIYSHAQPIVMDCEVVSACSVEGHAPLRRGSAVTGEAHKGDVSLSINPDIPKPGIKTGHALTASLLGSYVAFSVIDAGQTRACLSAGTCKEVNPLLRPFAGHPSGLVAVKLAANSGVAYGIWRMRKRHPKAALVLAMTAAGFQAAVVMQNARNR